jgi:hypothetical protein
MKAIIIILSYMLCACAVTTTTSTLPDGTQVVVVAKSSDPVAVQAAFNASAIIVPIIERFSTEQKTTK